jgi:glycosyl transferase family 25
MEHIHRIVYINLDRRTDRRQQLEDELQRLSIPGAKIERFAAVEHVEGLIGCGLSHLAVIRS